MMRIILGIIAFTLTFGLSYSLVGLLFGFPKPEVRQYSSTYNSAHKNNIKRLLSRDVRNGDIRNRTYYKVYRGEGNFEALHRNTEYTEAVENYYKKSASMNVSYLPEDFKYAWSEHMDAWKQQTVYLNSLQNQESDNSGTVVQIQSDNTNEINRTWFQVLRIAKRYGVKIPRSYYD